MEISEILQQAVGPIMLVFLFTSIFSLSLGVTLQGIVSALRDTRFLTVSLSINYVLVPLVAIGLTQFVPLDAATTTGLILYALMAGTEGGPKFVQFSGGNVPFALGLLVVMLIASSSLAPFVLPLFVQDGSVNLDMGALVVKLVVAVALPLCLGVFINSRYAAAAKWLHDISHHISVISLILAVTVLVYLNYQIYANLNLHEVLAGMTFFVIAFALGYVFGGPAIENRRALALMTLPRNGTISMLIAATVFGASHKIMAIVSIMAVTSVLLACAALVFFKTQQRMLNRPYSC